MKVREDIRKLTTTQSNLGKALGLTQPRINQLIEEGVVIRDERDAVGGVLIFESVKNFYTAKAADSGDDEADFWKEKALHERAKRELAEIKLAKTRGELYEAGTVEFVLCELVTNFRSKLLGLPSKYARRLEGKSRAEIYDVLTVAIEEELTELGEGLSGANFDEICADVDEDTDKKVDPQLPMC